MSEATRVGITHSSVSVTQSFDKYAVVGNIVAIEKYIKYGDNDPEMVEQFFTMMSDKDIRRLNKEDAMDVIGKIDYEERFDHFTKADFKKLRTAFSGNNGNHDFFEALSSVFKKEQKYNYTNLIHRKNFNPELLLRFHGDDHSVRRIDGTWMSIPHRFDYISGGIVSSEYKKLDEIVKILKKHKYVDDVEKIEIEYYNRDSCGTYGVEFTVELPQELYNEYVKKAKATRDDAYSTTVWETVLNRWGQDGKEDLLGIQKYQKSEEQKDQEYEDRCDERY